MLNEIKIKKTLGLNCNTVCNTKKCSQKTTINQIPSYRDLTKATKNIATMTSLVTAMKAKKHLDNNFLHSANQTVAVGCQPR